MRSLCALMLVIVGMGFVRVRVRMFVGIRLVGVTMLDLLLIWCEHVDLGSCQPAAHHPALLKTRAYVESSCSLLKHRKWNAGIDQRAEKHVTTDA